MPSIVSVLNFSALMFAASATLTTSPYVEADPISSNLAEDCFKKGWGNYGGMGGYSLSYGGIGGGNGFNNGGTSTFYSVITETATIQGPIETEYFTYSGATTTLSVVPETQVTTVHNVETSVYTVYNNGQGELRTATVTLQGSGPQTLTTVLV